MNHLMLHLLNSSLNLKILARLQKSRTLLRCALSTVCAAIGGFVGWEDIDVR